MQCTWLKISGSLKCHNESVGGIVVDSLIFHDIKSHAGLMQILFHSSSSIIPAFVNF